MRAKITKRVVDAMRPGDMLVDTEIKGFVARRLPSGVVTYGYRYRSRATRKRHWVALGIHGAITPDQARSEAERQRGEVADRRDPAVERETQREAARRAGADTVDGMLDQFIARHVKGQRSAAEVERVFNRYVRPRIGNKSIYELRRRDITEMLDAVADGGAPVMADRVLAHVRKAFNWQAARDDQFNSPIVKGMARTRPAERARKRVLSDEEIRDVWGALDIFDGPRVFGPLVRTLLLTAQRREEVAALRREEIEGDTWVIPGARHKTGDEAGDKVVPLTPAVQALLGTTQAAGFVFSTTRGAKPFSGFSKAKAALDAKINELRKAGRRKPMPPWVLHDLRRTARSLMSRAGVASDHAERVLGHAIPGVRGVYDRHAYVAEKRDALARLSALLERILSPAEANVIPIRAVHAP